jgi:ankyrin repeat protein
LTSFVTLLQQHLKKIYNASSSAFLLQTATQWIEESGWSKFANLLLENVVKPQPSADYPLSHFILSWLKKEPNFFPFFRVLSADQRIDISECQQLALTLACERDQIEMVKWLLSDCRIDPSCYQQHALKAACISASPELVKLLLADERVSPVMNRQQQALRLAIHHKRPQIVEVLLSDPRVDPAERSQQALRYAVEVDAEEAVEVLLQDERVNPSDAPSILYRACCNGNAKLVQMLLRDPRTETYDSSEPDSIPLLAACDHDSVEVVRVLLADQRIDPSAHNQIAITTAANGDITKLLMRDKRVDPSALDQRALYSALKYGHDSRLRWLLTDDRVQLADPIATVMMDLAWRQGYTQCIDWLLLRRNCRQAVLNSSNSTTMKEIKEKSTDILSSIETVEKQRRAALERYLTIADLADIGLSYVPDLFCHLDEIPSSWRTVRDLELYRVQFSINCLSSL